LYRPRKKHQPLTEWHLGHLARHVTADTVEASRGNNDVCALEIPWTEDEEDVVEAFRKWLQEHRGGASHAKPGRKHEWRTWFLNLAIYRLSASGFTRPQALKLLRNVSMSPQNFARAKRMIRCKIAWRFASMITAAKHDGSGDWTGHYIKGKPPHCQQMQPIPDK
jgi:hypothetical protein